MTKIVKAYVWETHFLSFYIDILLLGTNFKFYFAIYNLFWALFSMPFHFYVRFLVLWKIYIINKRFFSFLFTKFKNNSKPLQICSKDIELNGNLHLSICFRNSFYCTKTLFFCRYQWE